MSAAAEDPKYVRYLIAPVLIDGPELPLGEAEFRIIGTIAAAEHDDEPGMDPEPLRFRVTDWAGPWLPQNVTFEYRVVVPPGWPDPVDGDCEYGPVRGALAEALADVEDNFLIKPGDDIEWFIECRVAHEWKRRGSDSFVLVEPCGRVLVGRGSDTFDPCCFLPAGHKEPCKP